MLSLLLACGEGRPAPGTGCEPTEAAIRSAARGLVAADNAEDLDAVLDHYSDGITFITPEGEVVEGKPAVRPRYEALFDGFSVEIAMEVEEVGVGDEWAFVRGRNAGELRSRATGEAEPLRDRFLMILRCQHSAGWKVSRLMWVHER